MALKLLFSSLLLYSLILTQGGQSSQSSPSQSGTQRPPAPQPSPPTAESYDIVRISTNLVRVDVSVTKDGQPVTDLRPEDFEIFEDGKPQEISNFAYISNVPGATRVLEQSTAALEKKKSPKGTVAPPYVPARIQAHDERRTIALVIDDLGMSFESMAVVRQQVRNFLDSQVQPNDLVAIIRTAGNVGSLQQFTNDRRLLNNAYDHLKYYGCSRAGFMPCGTPSVRDTMRVLRFVLDGMRFLPGRKAMVLFSDDMPTEEVPSGLGRTPFEEVERLRQPLSLKDTTLNHYQLFESVSELAIRNSVVIYGIDTRGLVYTGANAADATPNGLRQANDNDMRGIPSTNDRLSMEGLNENLMRSRSESLWSGRRGSRLLSERTGGFMVFNSNDFGLQRILNDQQGYYLLGYRPGDETFNRKFHHIKAIVKRKGLTLRTRTGFYGVTDADAQPKIETASDQIDLALISPFSPNDITVQLTSFYANDAAAGPVLRSYLFLDPKQLTFIQQPDGSHKALFDLSSVVLGDNGAVVLRQDQHASLRLKGPPYERALREGFIYSFDLPVKQSGTLQFRVAVRDTGSTRLGSAGQLVEVPDLAKKQLALSGLVVRDESILAANDRVTQISNEGDNSFVLGPALRRFRQGVTLNFAYEIYNAALDQRTRQPQVTAQLRLFRDGKPIYAGAPRLLNMNGLSDPQRITDNARLQVDADFPTGQYVVQIVVTDELAKEKQRTATQWIDFEIRQ